MVVLAHPEASGRVAYYSLSARDITELRALEAQLRHALDHKTKPLGALGRLEPLALQLGLIQQSTTIKLTQMKE